MGQPFAHKKLCRHVADVGPAGGWRQRAGRGGAEGSWPGRVGLGLKSVPISTPACLSVVSPASLLLAPACIVAVHAGATVCPWTGAMRRECTVWLQAESESARL